MIGYHDGYLRQNQPPIVKIKNRNIIKIHSSTLKAKFEDMITNN